MQQPGRVSDLDEAAAPVTLATPPEPSPAVATVSRRHVRTLASGKAAIVVAGLTMLVWLIVNRGALVTMAMGLVVAVLADGWLARRALASKVVELSPVGDVVAGVPSRWHLHIPGVVRPITVRPTWIHRVPPILVDRDRPGILVLPPASRGLLPLVVLDLHAQGPIGLCRAGRRHVVVPARTQVVRPHPLPTTVRWPRPTGTAMEFIERTPRGDDEFRGVRPYRHGDERRKVHWKATARTGQTMVREEDGTGIVALQVVVDLDAPGAAAEDAVSTAVAITEAAVQQGWRVELVTLDATPDPPTIPSLGSPFRRGPFIRPGAVQELATVAQPVTSADAVRRQLATATAGTPIAPPWQGMRCTVSTAGVRFS